MAYLEKKITLDLLTVSSHKMTRTCERRFLDFTAEYAPIILSILTLLISGKVFIDEWQNQFQNEFKYVVSLVFLILSSITVIIAVLVNIEDRGPYKHEMSWLGLIIAFFSLTILFSPLAFAIWGIVKRNTSLGKNILVINNIIVIVGFGIMFICWLYDIWDVSAWRREEAQKKKENLPQTGKVVEV